MFNDSLFLKMSDPTVQWGDICLMEDVSTPVCDEHPQDVEFSMEEDALDGWIVPDLRLRKGIWENFPVDVIPVRSVDGTDRYKICWNKARISEWRNTRAETLDEYQDYEDFCYIRLFHALNKYAGKYRVEEAYDDSMLCVIAMVHAPHDATNEPAPTKAPAVDGKRALEVLGAFAVSWDRDGKVHRIKLHRKRAAELGVKENDVAFDLMGALASCSDCIVTPACGAGYMMTVTML